MTHNLWSSVGKRQAAKLFAQIIGFLGKLTIINIQLEYKTKQDQFIKVQLRIETHSRFTKKKSGIKIYLETEF